MTMMQTLLTRRSPKLDHILTKSSFQRHDRRYTVYLDLLLPIGRVTRVAVAADKKQHWEQ